MKQTVPDVCPRMFLLVVCGFRADRRLRVKRRESSTSRRYRNQHFSIKVTSGVLLSFLFWDFLLKNRKTFPSRWRKSAYHMQTGSAAHERRLCLKKIAAAAAPPRAVRIRPHTTNLPPPQHTQHTHTHATPTVDYSSTAPSPRRSVS